MIKPIRSEGDFQRWALKQFDLVGHAQDHRHSALPHVPDMSAAADGLDMWLELKYGRFSLSAGPEGRDYDTFEFKEVTRGQLDWLTNRNRAGAALCGIFGYLDILPSRLTQYLFYMDSDTYLEVIYKEKKKPTIAALLLGGNTVLFDERMQNDPRALIGFLDRFNY